eukprot:354461-Chlamydomonas_euryale.AAC.6
MGSHSVKSRHVCRPPSAHVDGGCGWAKRPKVLPCGAHHAGGESQPLCGTAAPARGYPTAPAATCTAQHTYPGRISHAASGPLAGTAAAWPRVRRGPPHAAREPSGAPAGACRLPAATRPWQAPLPSVSIVDAAAAAVAAAAAAAAAEVAAAVVVAAEVAAAGASATASAVLTTAAAPPCRHGSRVSRHTICGRRSRHVAPLKPQSAIPLWVPHIEYLLRLSPA